MKFLKGLLKFLLTIFLIVDLFLLGLVLNLKATVKEMVTYTLKQGITTELADYIPNENTIDKDKVINEIDKLITENKEIQQIVDKYIDIFLDIINGKEISNKFDLENDIDIILNESESILKQYNIEIDDDIRKEIKELVVSDEITGFLNEGIDTYSLEIPKEYESVVRIIMFITSTTFKLILIVSFIVIIGLIALLKKSTYRWLSSLGSASIISGVMILIITITANYLPTLLNNDSISISLGSLNNYGLVSAVLGIIEFMIYVLITKKTKKNQEQNIEID